MTLPDNQDHKYYNFASTEKIIYNKYWQISMKRTKRRIPVNPHGQASTYAISNLWRVSAITYFSLILLLSAKQTYIVCVSPNVVCVLVC